MMFNKILVIADEKTSIQQYEKLAQTVFSNLNPATDVVFTNGPMDVLDHSCSKLGFGGKMCIDGTKKTEEEIDENYNFSRSSLSAAQIEQSILAEFSNVKSVNASLLDKDIPCLIIAVQKTKRGEIAGLHTELNDKAYLAGVKMILYVEHTVDPKDLPIALWRFCNNLDPKRDQILYKTNTLPYQACIGLDGTMKTKELDGFQRDWPNIIVANDETIEAVDKKWGELNIGTFISSPSLKFKNQMYGDEAVAKS